jgi:hypothetical protein
VQEETADEQTERLFCIDNHGECRGLSQESQIVAKEKRAIKVRGKEVQGWIVTIKAPATDGLVRSNPLDPTSQIPVGGEE